MENYTSEIINLIAEAMDCEPTELDENTDFRAHELYDSLVYMSIVALIDENYNVHIPQSDFIEFKSIKEVADYIKSKRS